MKMYVPTTGLLDRIAVLSWAEDVTFICHDIERALRLKDETGKEVIVSKPRSADPHDIIQCNRSIVLDMLKEGEWAAIVDENVRLVTGFDDSIFHSDLKQIDPDEDWKVCVEWAYSWHSALSVVLTWDQIQDRLAALARTCEVVGTGYGGCTYKGAYIYRLRKYQFFATFPTCLVVVSKSNRPFVYHALHDTEMCIYWMKTAGCVVTANWFKPIKTHYQPNGLGPLNERKKLRVGSAQSIADSYSFIDVHPTDNTRIVTDWRFLHREMKEANGRIPMDLLEMSK